MRCFGRRCSAGDAATIEQRIDQHSDSAYAVIRFGARCEVSQIHALDIEYSLWVCKVVTAFTVAHSITLSLAALAELPSRLVESAIALSFADGAE